ncbi:Putative ribonuclease YwqJ [Peribacillus simplex]|uniref:ribonuclease YeeF family protein n=1 Tax=Peribacillus simplex TaxID=1478 RepID=UPI001E06AFEE|nr:T7SS effector LXG polymorphic toxin [Peribacillus simplex]CAH0242920.1 Putative ribonuclease YwqJ [Peribacillus simplex]
MKIYEAETLTAATKSRAKQYEELKKEVAALKKEFQGIVGLDNEFQGAGATAIKSFYEAQIEVADAWMELFTTQISFLEGIPASLEEADLSGNTVVEVPFLDGEVSNGINQAKSLVDEQANDLQRILDSIDDILPLDMFDQKDFNEKITLAGHRLDDTVTKLENVDRQLVEEYDVSVGQENVAVGLFRALLDATKQDGNVSPMTFNQSAFKNSDVYQVKDEVAGQMKDYQTFKKQQAEARKIEQEMEELENRPWYEKAWDTTKTFTGEFTGYYDSIRASTGVDPVTGRKLSDAERIAAGAMAAAGFIPVVGWAGRAIKGGSALYKTAKGLNAADHALDAYKTTKGFSLLQKTEYGIYGLLAANGLGEAVTGKDMFGNQLTEEQRQNGLLMALGIGGVAGVAKVADKVASGTKFVPYSKEFAQKQVQKVQATITDIARSGKTTLKNIGEELGKKEIPKRISVEQVSLAGGPNLPHVVMEKQTIKEAYQKFTVKDSKVEAASGESIPKGTGETKNLSSTGNKIEVGKVDLDELRKNWNVPETNTIAVGRTDIKGLEDLTFKGGSPEVRKEAGLPSLDEILPNRDIRAPYDHLKNPKLAQFTRHAEEGVLNEFDSVVKKAGIEPSDITGTLRIHQSNPRGVCNKCSKGLLKPYPIEKSGIFYQASKKYPNLTIVVTSEINDSVKTNGLLSFVLKDGKIE